MSLHQDQRWPEIKYIPDNAKKTYCKADDDKKADIDHHKNDQLNKQKEGKGHWKRELGSNSESAVCLMSVQSADVQWLIVGFCLYQIKADRHEIGDAEKDIESLQKQTSQAMEDDHEHATKK